MSSKRHLSLSLLGYNRKQVDQLLEEQREEVQALEERIKDLEKASDSLSDQLEHYIGLEEALKEGIVDAHMAGNEIIEKSNKRADSMLEQTSEKVTQYKEDFAHQSRELVHHGQNLQEQFKAMKHEFQTIIDHYQDLLDRTDFDRIYPKKQIERMLKQVETYEDEEWLDSLDEDHIELSATSLNESEQNELARLIQEVIGEEEEASDEKSKLVEFQKVKESK